MGASDGDPAPKEPASLYFLLKTPAAFAEVSNLDYAHIEKDLRRADMSEAFAVCTEQLLLLMLNGYDISTKKPCLARFSGESRPASV